MRKGGSATLPQQPSATIGRAAAFRVRGQGALLFPSWRFHRVDFVSGRAAVVVVPGLVAMTRPQGHRRYGCCGRRRTCGALSPVEEPERPLTWLQPQGCRRVCCHGRGAAGENAVRPWQGPPPWSQPLKCQRGCCCRQCCGALVGLQLWLRSQDGLLAAGRKRVAAVVEAADQLADRCHRRCWGAMPRSTRAATVVKAAEQRPR